MQMLHQRIQVGLITLGISLGLASCSGGGSSQVSSDSPLLAYSCEGLAASTGGQAADCELVEQLRNAQYTIPDVGLVQLVNGRFDNADGRRVEFLDPPSPTTLGDLKDGTTATASLISVSTGTTISVYLALATQQGDRFRPVSVAYLGDRVQVQSIRFSEGQVQVNLLTQAADDPPCCPTLEAVRTYEFDGGNLDLVSQFDLGRVAANPQNDASKETKQSSPNPGENPSATTDKASAELTETLKDLDSDEPQIIDPSILSSPSDRSLYAPTDLPDGVSSIGPDPSQIALEAFGSKEPMEGDYRESVVIEQGNNSRAVTLILENLPDDSIRSLRYRLEFVPAGEEWQVDWIGVQTSCRPGRGTEEWSAEPCS